MNDEMPTDTGALLPMDGRLHSSQGKKKTCNGPEVNSIISMNHFKQIPPAHMYTHINSSNQITYIYMGLKKI